jgi:hypothetical protein
MRAISSFIRLATLTLLVSCASSPPPARDAHESTGEPAPAPAANGVDLSCKQASDCAIKNVGSCCGYNPRCVNAQSTPVPPVCPEDTVSTCGFPEVTHCECFDNECTSMQNDRPI